MLHAIMVQSEKQAEKRISHMAELLGLPMAPHFSEEISVEVLCAIQNATFLEHAPETNLNDSGLLVGSFALRDGYACLPINLDMA